MRKGKKSFKDLSPPQQAAAIGAGIVALALIATAQRDIQSRPEADIRGPKLLWRLASLNAVGAIAYLRWGRRPA